MSITATDTGLIYRNPKPHLVSRHAYFPSVVVLPDGRLFAAFDLGSAFEAVDVRTHYALSSDHGETWTDPLPIPLPAFDQPFSGTCRFSLSPNDELIGVGALWDRSREGEGLASTETGGFAETHPFLVRADAHSLQWESPAWLETPLPGPFEICSPVFFAQDGAWLWPASTWKDWSGHAPHGMHAIVLRSTDRGRTWTSWHPVMDGRSREVIHWEIKLAQLPDGKILALSWTHDAKAGQDLPIHFAISSDDGRTFSAPQSTGLLGQTCTPVVLPDGRILSIYRRKDQPGLWAQLSELKNGSWINHETDVLWGGASHGRTGAAASATQQMSALRFGLPAVKLLPDGTPFVAFWCMEDAVSVIRWFKLRLA